MTAGFAQQSAKYGGTVPQENPLRYNHHRARRRCPAVPTPIVPAYTASDQATVLAGAPGRHGARGADPLDRGRRSPLLEPRHPGLQRRRRPGLEHRREPVPVDDERGRSGRRRSSSTRAAARRSSSASSVPAAGMTTLAAATAVGDTNVKVAVGRRTSTAGPAVLRRHRLEPRDRPDPSSARRRHRHRRDAGRAAQARACERRAVPRQPGPAGRVHGRHARAPELLRLGRTARRSPATPQPTRGAPAGARAAGDVHVAARERQQLPRRGAAADRARSRTSRPTRSTRPRR